VKTDSVGVVQWTKTYGGSSGDTASCVIEHSIDNNLVFAGKTESFGAGSEDVMLVVQPSDGSGTAGASATTTEGSPTLTEDVSIIAEDTPTLLEGDVTLVQTSTTVITTVVFANATPSKSPSSSQSMTKTRTPSITKSISRTRTLSTTKSVSRTRTPSTTKSISRTRTLSTTKSVSRTRTPSTTKSVSRTRTPSTTKSVSRTRTPSTTKSFSRTRTPSTTKSVSRTRTSGASTTASQTASSTSSTTKSVSPSTTNSVSSTKSVTRTPSSSLGASASLSTTVSQTHTPSHTASSSKTASRTAFQTASVSPSVSASADNPCDGNQCVLNSTCVVSGSGNQYTCDCTTVSTAAKKTIVVGQYCNTTIEGKPVSVGGGNCPGCASVFICTDYTGDNPLAYMQSVEVELAASYCSCKDPPNRLVSRFGGVQFVEMSASELCMEFTIYSGNPATPAQDILATLETNPPPGFTVQEVRIEDLELCIDAEKGCNLEAQDDDSLRIIVIGVACFVILFLLCAAWCCVRKRRLKQWNTRKGNLQAGGIKMNSIQGMSWPQVDL
jgi:hypothetical protein